MEDSQVFLQPRLPVGQFLQEQSTSPAPKPFQEPMPSKLPIHELERDDPTSGSLQHLCWHLHVSRIPGKLMTGIRRARTASVVPRHLPIDAWMRLIVFNLKPLGTSPLAH